MPFNTNRYNASFCLISLVCMLAACNSPSNDIYAPHDALNVTVPKPTVHRDFDTIEETGKLRMITRYSSNTYFLHHGLEYGFEYELMHKFAENHDLTLDVIVVRPGQNPYDMLNRGDGDVIAANYTITPARQRYVNFTHAYNLVNQVLVFSTSRKDLPLSMQQVAQQRIPITIRKNSSYYQNLQRLKRKGYPFRIQTVSNERDTESLLFDISRGKYAATVADNNIFQASNNYMDNLVRGPVLARNDSIAWAVRKNSPELRKKMNAFIDRNFRIDTPGQSPKRSAFLNILRKRYFERGPQIAGYYDNVLSPDITGRISPYDELFKQEADSVGLDWLILAAMTAQETRFNPRSKSWAGAIGLMQVLPRYSEVRDVKKLYDPQTNIREGARIIQRQLQHYDYMDSTARWHFALAAYNAGQGHVNDARRLVMDQEQNPNKWQPTASALLKLMNRTYYKNARHGFCRCIETVRYVQNIMNRYHTYKNILKITDSTRQKNWPGLFDGFERPLP